MRESNRRALAALSVLAMTACTREPPPRTDTAVATPQAEEAPAVAAPSANIGKLALLASPAPDGVCTVEQLSNAAVVRNVMYEGDYPRRKIMIGVGAPERAYRPINLEISVSQDAGVGQQDVETMRVIFLPDGGIRHGVRQYTGPGGNEQSGLLAGDSSRVKDLVGEVLTHCKDQD